MKKLGFTEVGVGEHPSRNFVELPGYKFMDFSSKVWCRGCLLGFLSFYWCRIWLCDFCNFWNWFWLVRCWGDRGSLRSGRSRVFVWVWGELTPVAYTLRLSIGRQPCEAEAKHQELN